MCEGLWELQMIGEIQEQIPQVCFQSSLPLMLPSHPWRWDFPDSLLWAAMSTALAFGALGWGWKDILIFCILLPRGLFSSACQQPHSLPWPSCQVKLHLAIAPLCVLLGFCLKDHLQIWSQLNLYISLFPVREYDIHYRCSDWFWIFPALTLKFSLAFLLSFFFLTWNGLSSCKESGISSPQGTQRSPCPNSSWNRWGKTRTQAPHSQSSGLSR